MIEAGTMTVGLGHHRYLPSPRERGARLEHDKLGNPRFHKICEAVYLPHFDSFAKHISSSQRFMLSTASLWPNLR